MARPQGCDTLVVRGDATKDGWLIFGKNSDRPLGEVQEVVYEPPRKPPAGATVKCTYVEVPEAGETFGVLLSRPSWLWGAEMGANDNGVVIGNEAVWTKFPGEPKEGLLGMDLLRLGLERGATAGGALDVITALLEEHGQGGACGEGDTSFTYDNSYLIADRSGDVWVLETAGREWAAKKVTEPHANISNNLTLEGTVDNESKNCRDTAKKLGGWDGTSAFNFAAAFSSSGKGNDEPRQKSAGALLASGTKAKAFDAAAMMAVLRDCASGLNMGQRTTGSMVSILPLSSSKSPCVHLVTGTADPALGLFKPFLFAEGCEASPLTKSDPKKGQGQRAHALWAAQQRAMASGAAEAKRDALRALEASTLEEVEGHLREGTAVHDAGSLFHECAEAQMALLGE